MKKLFTIIALAFTCNIYAQGTVYTAPKTFSGNVNLTKAVIFGSEAASTHNYTFTGNSSIVYVTTTRKDTINLVAANMLAGQRTMFITTTAANDSTLLLPDAGSINGGASYWVAGATATYKGATLVYDGTNYFIAK